MIEVKYYNKIINWIFFKLKKLHLQPVIRLAIWVLIPRKKNHLTNFVFFFVFLYIHHFNSIKVHLLLRPAFVYVKLYIKNNKNVLHVKIFIFYNHKWNQLSKCQKKKLKLIVLLIFISIFYILWRLIKNLFKFNI